MTYQILWINPWATLGICEGLNVNEWDENRNRAAGGNSNCFQGVLLNSSIAHEDKFYLWITADRRFIHTSINSTKHLILNQ